jgi:hypothetical protein
MCTTAIDIGDVDFRTEERIDVGPPGFLKTFWIAVSTWN